MLSLQNLRPDSKLGRIHSNLFQFRFFEFRKWNSKFEFGRIRKFDQVRPNSIKFDQRFWYFDLGWIKIRPNSTILGQIKGQENNIFVSNTNSNHHSVLSPHFMHFFWSKSDILNYFWFKFDKIWLSLTKSDQIDQL